MKSKKLHRNTLYPLYIVDPSGDVNDNPTMMLAKANVIVDKHFACDCGNCRDTV